MNHAINQIIAFHRIYVYIATPIKIIMPMNKQRRKRLQNVLSEVERIEKEVNETKAKAEQLANDIETLGYEIETLYDEEQEAHDNLPDQLQWSEKGETMQAIADALDEAKSYIEEASTPINNALNL